MNNCPKSRTENIVVQEIKDEILIYDLTTNKAVCLNETSRLVWSLCDGNKTVNEIAELLSKKVAAPIDETLVLVALDRLHGANLLDDEEALEIDFGGVSRREAIRKIGLTSMIALPMISVVVAPMAAQAQSGCGGAGVVLNQSNIIGFGNDRLACTSFMSAMCCSGMSVEGNTPPRNSGCTCVAGNCTGMVTCV